MSKVQKEKSTKEGQGYLCFVYGGCMKTGWIRYFSCDHAPEEEYEKFKNHYGSDIKGRYIKVSNPTDAYSKVRAELTKNNITNTYGDIYEMGILAAANYMKDANGVKKTSTWGNEGDDEESDKKVENTDKSQKSKPKGAKGKKKATEAQEIDAEDEDNEAHVEPPDVNVEKKTKPKKQKAVGQDQSHATEEHTTEAHVSEANPEVHTTEAKEEKQPKKTTKAK